MDFTPLPIPEKVKNILIEEVRKAEIRNLQKRNWVVRFVAKLFNLKA